MASRRVGEYQNPKTLEIDWLEVDTAKEIVLQSKMITKVGDTTSSVIDIKLDNDNSKETICLYVEYRVNGNVYTSKKVHVSDKAFANELARVTYEQTALDDTTIVKDMTAEAMEDLTKTLMDNGILTGGMKFNGIGFVYVTNEKVMTIENLDFEYRVESSRPIHEIKLHNCVSLASLENLDNPHLEFFTGTHKISCNNLEIIESSEGKLKNYTIKIPSFDIKKDTTIPEYQVFDSKDFGNDDCLDDFIKARKSMLDDGNNDSELDDRFGNLL